MSEWPTLDSRRNRGEYANSIRVFLSPARFYASQLLKLILIHLITNYDFKLADEKASQKFSLEMDCVLVVYM